MLKRLKSATLDEFVNVNTATMLLRLYAFLMIYCHGFGKVMSIINGNLFIGKPDSPMDPIGLGPGVTIILAALAEGICALFVLVGFWTRLASLILIVNMSLITFFVHVPADYGLGNPGMELGVTYLIAFIVIFLLGPGDHSVDKTVQENNSY